MGRCGRAGWSVRSAGRAPTAATSTNCFEGPAATPPTVTVVPAPHRKESNNMRRAGKTLTVVVVAALGLWGCPQGSNGDSAERVRLLENECKVLKDDYRSVAGA